MNDHNITPSDICSFWQLRQKNFLRFSGYLLFISNQSLWEWEQWQELVFSDRTGKKNIQSYHSLEHYGFYSTISNIFEVTPQMHATSSETTFKTLMSTPCHNKNLIFDCMYEIKFCGWGEEPDIKKSYPYQ